MEIKSLISKVVDAGVALFLQDGQLKFKAEKGKMSPELLAILKEHKPAIIDYLKSIENTDVEQGFEIPDIEHHEWSDEVPISFAQQRILFIYQLETGSAQYNIPDAFRLQGDVNIDAIEFAIQEIINRHQVVRTGFIENDGELVQFIRQDYELPFAVVDLSSRSANEQKIEVTQRIDKDVIEPFDLQNDILLRFQLLKLSEKEYILLVNMHHIASDGWSMTIILQELCELYSARCEGKPNPLVALPVQYADYAHWQREWLQGEVLDQQKTYWVNQLEGIPSVHNLPLDMKRPTRQGFQAHGYEHIFPAGLTSRINAHCREEGVTLFMFLQTALSVLLSKFSGEKDIIMGTPVAGRDHASLEGLVGFFNNTLVLRTNLEESADFQTLLQASKKTILDAFTHQHVPYEMLVKELKPERTLAYNPICQIKFALHNFQEKTVELPTLTLTGMEKENPKIHFDLDLSVTPHGETLKLLWTYKTELFEAETIKRMAAAYEQFILMVLEQPKVSLASIDLLGTSERNTLASWKGDSDLSGRETSVPEQFLYQAVKTPGAIALQSEGLQLTYRELSEKAMRLAACLNEQGIGRGDRVGLYFDRSAELIVGLLGAMMSGASYVPFDPKQTGDRLSHMLSEADIQLVLVQNHLMSKLPLASIDVMVVGKESHEEGWLDEYQTVSKAELNLPSKEDAAYVIYTSGSTGKPKGVEVLHSGLTDYCAYASQRYYQKELYGSLVATLHSFDLTIPALYLPLLSGGCVELLPFNEELEALANVLSETQAKSYLLRLTPLHIRGMLDLMKAGSCTQDHVFVVGGEEFLPSLANDLTQKFPNAKVYNHYGPTETVVGCTLFEIEKGVDYGQLGNGKIPIGFPMANTSVYVLDENKRQVPIGVQGELYISGPCVANGYVNQPALTAEKFVANPVEADSKYKAYRTGDLVRWLSTGNLEFVGRTDNQVKIRGHRIELGEMEQQLSNVSWVTEGVVLVQEDEIGERQLVAFIAAEGKADMSALKSHLAANLPNYMVPAFFVSVESIPRTRHGKVDRKALLALDVSNAGEKKYTAPETEVEVKLAKIFADVLKVETVGIHDSFFELGGHSLLATRCVSLIRQEFKLELQLRVLFENSTVAQLAESFETASDTLILPDIEVVSDRENMELSYAQQRLWFIDQLEGGSAHYNLPGVFTMEGQLNLPAFKSAIKEVINRHEILRTTYLPVKGAAVQVVMSHFELPIEELDLTGLEGMAQEEEVKKLAETNANAVFDLSKDLMIRVQLLRLSEEYHVVLFNIHHIASDGWSRGILIQDFSTFYHSFAKGETDPLPPLRVQYSDYAQWQKQWLQGPILERQLAYWKNRLEGIPSIHNLPLDRARPAEPSYHGERHQRLCDKEKSESIYRFCQKHDVTLFMFLQTAFAVLLSRNSREDDIVVGTPIAGRVHKDIEGLIGFFVNSLVLRSDLSDDPAFSDLLATSKQHILDAYTHQYLPFEMLVEEINPERSMGHSPLFQVVIILQNNEQASLNLPDLKLRPQEEGPFVIKFDLEFSILETKDGLQFNWTYNTDLFNLETVERLADQFDALTEGILSEPTRSVSQLPLQTAAEEQHLLNTTNRELLEFKSEETIHALFEAQVLRNPESIAVVFGDTSLSYGELNTGANRLAYFLKEKGVGPESLVTICLERSPLMIVAILGVLKAGGAYVPVDPTHPTERKRYTIADSQASVLITEQSLSDDFKDESIAVVLLDESRERLSKYPTKNPVSESGPNNLAYVIYTSGSTGNPKGVLIEHGNVNRLFQATNKEFSFGEDDVWTCFHSLAFDFTVWEIWGALLSGARMVIVPYLVARDPNEFYNLVVREKVTVLSQTPSAFKQLIAVDDANRKKLALRYVVFGGEALDFEMLTPWFKHHAYNAPMLVNMYGITETTVHATFFRITEDAVARNSGSIIGKALADLSFYVLDQHGLPVPFGIPGELHIGGGGVARGYLNRPELTEARFIPNTLKSAESRLYKTGDLVRFQEGGQLEFLGRIDEQVKIRGFRIELGEIESRIKASNGITDAVVLAKEGSDGQKILVGYICSNRGVDTTDLRLELGQHLPDYMVPTAFVEIDELPLTSNGKVDKKGLLRLEAQTNSGRDYQAPSNATEEKLAVIFGQILNIEEPGVHDNFFELGGHSLLATQLISLVRQELGTELSLRALFEHPTIHGIARTFEGADQPLVLPAISALLSREKLRLSYAQQRLWFIDKLEGGSPQYNMTGAFRLQGKLNQSAFEQTIREIIERHEILRSRFEQDGDQVFQVVSEEYDVPLKEADLRTIEPGLRDDKALEIAYDDALKPFNLQEDLLIRFQLVRMDSEEYMVLFNMHHIASDGWSMNVLARDFCTIYKAIHEDGVTDLPQLRVQYADFANWQKEWLKGDVLAQQLEYWKDQLADIPAVHNLPLDKPRPQRQTYSANSFKRRISSEQFSRVTDFCKEYDVTLFMFLQTALSVLLGHYSNQKDIVVGTPIAGRNHKDTEDLIGFFLNTLVLRTDLENNPSFEKLLEANKQTILDAYTYQHLPYEMLVEEIKPERNLAYNPICQVKFVLQNQGESEVDLPELTLTSVDRPATKIRFDLDLTVTEKDNFLRLDWTYKTDLFEQSSIERMADSFGLLIEQILEAPKKDIGQYRLLSESEEQVLANRKGQLDLEGRDSTVPKRFEKQARKTPHQVAVRCGNDEFTYESLNEKSDRLASYLREQEIGSGDYVGLYFERSAELMVALLGVMKAGAAYVPLDPDQSGHRLEHMIKQAGIELILVQSELMSKISLASIDVLVFDSTVLQNEWLVEYANDSEEDRQEIQSEDSAYVIFTSGSTGTPKGVEISHASLIDYCAFGLDQYYEPVLEGSLVATSHCFDITIPSLYLPLMAGDCVELVPKDQDLATLATTLGNLESGNFLLRLTPMHIQALLGLLPKDEMWPQRHVFVIGGELLRWELANELSVAFPKARIYNHYGPTETVVGCCMYEVEEGGQGVNGGYGVPIGSPMANTELHVLNEEKLPVPIGVAGELYISGPCVGKGYINQPELTDERFLPDPFADGSEQRMYRTGDRVRWLSSGHLEFVERVDHQLKIRGYRVEPGEIESHLRKLDGIEDALVLAKQFDEGFTNLVAYVVTATNTDGFDQQKTKATLGKELPAYMVPAFVLSVDQFPLNRNGKIDKKALLALDVRTGVQVFEPLSTEHEEKLGAIYAQVLGVEEIGARDNFFELGGHSLLAIKLLNQISAEFGFQMDIRDIFEYPVLADMAARIADQEETLNAKGKLFDMATDLKEFEI